MQMSFKITQFQGTQWLFSKVQNRGRMFISTFASIYILIYYVFQIRRLSLNSYVDNLSESVVQDSMGNSVENLVVDALQGFLYWSTQLSVEAARLNGRNYTTIFSVPNAYSGMGDGILQSQMDNCVLSTSFF